MRVNHKNDRQDAPDECDNCGSEVRLIRYESYGPGFQVSWLCHYCDRVTGTMTGENRALCQGLNALEGYLLLAIQEIDR
jgi:hypothetical protein